MMSPTSEIGGYRQNRIGRRRKMKYKNGLVPAETTRNSVDDKSVTHQFGRDFEPLSSRIPIEKRLYNERHEDVIIIPDDTTVPNEKELSAIMIHSTEALTFKCFNRIFFFGCSKVDDFFSAQQVAVNIATKKY